jgi:hypothetical protein
VLKKPKHASPSSGSKSAQVIRAVDTSPPSLILPRLLQDRDDLLFAVSRAFHCGSSLLGLGEITF